MAIMTKIGVALATYNSKEQLNRCLLNLFKSQGVCLYVVVVDDNSRDGTWEMLSENYPQVIKIKGNGNLWWTGATNLAVNECLKNGCDGVILINPDVLVEEQTISVLAKHSMELCDSIVSPVVLDVSAPDVVWEAGHRWEPLIRGIPLIWTFKYLFKHNTPVSSIPKSPYKTVSVVGRGGYIPKKAFLALGLFDSKNLPHYGADADMGLRAWKNKFPMYIIPQAIVYLQTENTGRKVPNTLRSALVSYFNYLTKRKNGEALRVLFIMNFKNLPFISALATYLYMLLLNSFRFWQAFLISRNKRKIVRD